MQILPTVLLEHVTRTDRHYDWLVGMPTGLADHENRLWSLRVKLPSWHWQAAGKIMATQLPPHRRVYLQYEGPLSRQRGVVRRVDEGTATATMWTQSKITLLLKMQRTNGVFHLYQATDPQQWNIKYEP